MLRLARTLTLEDFERSAIWEEIGSERANRRYRPRPDLGIADDPESETGSLIVATAFTLADRSVLAGYCSPTSVAVLNERIWLRGLGLLRPTIVLEHGQVPFWFDEEPSRDQIQALYARLERGAEQVFPIAFQARVPAPDNTFACGRLEGFYFARRPPFSSPSPLLNRTLLAERLGHVR